MKGAVAEEDAAHAIVALLGERVVFAFGERAPVKFVDAGIRNESAVPVSLEDGSFAARRPPVHVDLLHIRVGIRRDVNGGLGIGWKRLSREEEWMVSAWNVGVLFRKFHDICYYRRCTSGKGLEQERKSPALPEFKNYKRNMIIHGGGL